MSCWEMTGNEGWVHPKLGIVQPTSNPTDATLLERRTTCLQIETHDLSNTWTGVWTTVSNPGRVMKMSSNMIRAHWKLPKLLTSSTFPDVLSFQQKWIRESSDCWMYTMPLRLSGVTTFPFRVILPARNSTRYLLELPLEPLTKLGKRAPDDIFQSVWKPAEKLEEKRRFYQSRHFTVAWLVKLKT